MNDLNLSTQSTPDEFGAYRGATDSLTGLPTESVFRTVLERCLTQSRETSINASLALLQLANFYEILQWVGPAETDLLVCDIVRSVRKCLPESVFACRCQNHEFALLLRDECNDNAPLIIERIQAVLESTASSVIPPQVTLRCGVGIVAISPQVPSVEVLYAQARHSICQSPDDALSIRSMPSINTQQLSSDIIRALNAHSMELLFQPIVGLEGDPLSHFEVYAHLDRSIADVSTSFLFEAATQNAMAGDIDRYVILKAIQHLAGIEPETLLLTINLSLNSLTSDSFCDWFIGVMRDNKISPEQIILQISEVDMLIAQHYLQSFSMSLYQHKIRLSVRHFGCTPDASKYLSLVKLHQVKLDGSVLENLLAQSTQRNKLRRMTDTLLARGIRPIACKLEDIRLLPVLWEMGIREFQGNGLQGPASETLFDFPAERSIQC